MQPPQSMGALKSCLPPRSNCLRKQVNQVYIVRTFSAPTAVAASENYYFKSNNLLFAFNQNAVT